MKIKLVAFDVDGVMTDGSLTFFEDGREIKTFNAKDGHGVVMLNRKGFITAIITARESEIVERRAQMLEITKVFQGAKNKIKALEALCEEFKVSFGEVAYMGDDLPDLCVLEKVALSGCPADAVEEVKQKCKFISKKEGGKGAVREFCDLIIENYS